MDVLLSERNANGPASCFSFLSRITVLISCGGESHFIYAQRFYHVRAVIPNCGVVLCWPSYPVYLMAEGAGTLAQRTKTIHADMTFSVISREVSPSRYLTEGQVHSGEARGMLQVEQVGRSYR